MPIYETAKDEATRLAAVIEGIVARYDAHVGTAQHRQIGLDDMIALGLPAIPIMIEFALNRPTPWFPWLSTFRKITGGDVSPGMTRPQAIKNWALWALRQGHYTTTDPTIVQEAARAGSFIVDE